MNRVKRESDDKIYKQGYNQGIKGHGSRLCPYEQDDEKRGLWLGGWRRGHEDFQAGYRRGLGEVH